MKIEQEQKYEYLLQIYDAQRLEWVTRDVYDAYSEAKKEFDVLKVIKDWIVCSKLRIVERVSVDTVMDAESLTMKTYKEY